MIPILLFTFIAFAEVALLVVVWQNAHWSVAALLTATFVRENARDIRKVFQERRDTSVTHGTRGTGGVNA